MWRLLYYFSFLVSMPVLFKQKTAYERRISDWSSDVCSSDLALAPGYRVSCSERDILVLEREKRNRTTWQIGRASCRERVCQYVSLSVVAVTLKKKEHKDASTRSQHHVVL